LKKEYNTQVIAAATLDLKENFSKRTSIQLAVKFPETKEIIPERFKNHQISGICGIGI